MKVYGGIWRYIKVYKGLWRYMEVYGYMQVCGSMAGLRPREETIMNGGGGGGGINAFRALPPVRYENNYFNYL